MSNGIVLPRHRRLLEAQGYKAQPTGGAAEQERACLCQRCQGNGEIVTDWDRYLHARPGDVGDEAVAECPDCNGEGEITLPQGGDHD